MKAVWSSAAHLAATISVLVGILASRFDGFMLHRPWFDSHPFITRLIEAGGLEVTMIVVPAIILAMIVEREAAEELWQLARRIAEARDPVERDRLTALYRLRQFEADAGPGRG